MAEAKRHCPDLVVVPYEFDRYEQIARKVVGYGMCTWGVQAVDPSTLVEWCGLSGGSFVALPCRDDPTNNMKTNLENDLFDAADLFDLAAPLI